MTSLSQIQFEDENGQTFDVLVQSSEAISSNPVAATPDPEDEYEESMGIQDVTTNAIQNVKKVAQKVSLKAVQGTIQTYTKIAIGAFQNLPGVEVDEVTLKFGIAIEGTTGMPILMGGSAGANFEIEVKCKPKSAEQDGQKT